MDCRIGCGACCIAISISSPIPGMPAGKAAGVRCIQLSDDHRCLIFGHPQRPKVCDGFRAARDTCGESREDAMRYLGWLEGATMAAGALRQAADPIADPVSGDDQFAIRL